MQKKPQKLDSVMLTKIKPGNNVGTFIAIMKSYICTILEWGKTIVSRHQFSFYGEKAWDFSFLMILLTFHHKVVDT